MPTTSPSTAGRNSSTTLTMAIETSIATNGIPDIGRYFPTRTLAIAAIATRAVHAGVSDAGAADPGGWCNCGLRVAHVKQRHPPADRLTTGPHAKWARHAAAYLADRTPDRSAFDNPLPRRPAFK